jgi:hypothetical protein
MKASSIHHAKNDYNDITDNWKKKSSKLATQGNLQVEPKQNWSYSQSWVSLLKHNLAQHAQSDFREDACCRFSRRKDASPNCIPDPIRSGSNSPEIYTKHETMMGENKPVHIDVWQ